MTPRLYLFDDARARRWSPFALTRPIGELLHGCLSQRERWARIWRTECVGHVSRDALGSFAEPGCPPVVGPRALADDTLRVIVSSRCVPQRLDRMEWPGGPSTLRVDGEVVGWVLPPGAASPSEETLLDPGGSPPVGEVIELEGRMLEWPWDLVHHNPERIAQDMKSLHHAGGTFQLRDVQVVGDGALSLGHQTVVEPGVVLDVREGPIRLDDRVTVRGPGRLVGPLFVGQDTTVFGGQVGMSSIGPSCKVRGEIEGSVLLGYVNKAHDGYLGHAYVGRWVNLGAFTTNSDLKNNYSSVRVLVADKEAVDTGLLKVGCFLGDHVKTGIGTLLNTGTVIGAGSNVFGGAMPPTYVPPFSWGAGEAWSEYRLDRFLSVAETVFSRRGLALTEADRELLTRSWEDTRSERARSRAR